MYMHDIYIQCMYTHMYTRGTRGYQHVYIVHVYACSTCKRTVHVAASLSTFSRVGVYTLARACASALLLWRNKCF